RNSGWSFDGLIDDVKIYNYARTEEQILEDMYGGHPIESTENPVPKVTQVFGGDNEDGTIIDGAGAPPIAHWTFDEKTGTTVEDKSGNGNNGTVNGATWTQGKYGSGLSFDGEDDYVRSANNITFNTSTDSYTLSAWIKATEVPFLVNPSLQVVGSASWPSVGYSIRSSGTSYCIKAWLGGSAGCL